MTARMLFWRWTVFFLDVPRALSQITKDKQWDTHDKLYNFQGQPVKKLLPSHQRSSEKQTAPPQQHKPKQTKRARPKSKFCCETTTALTLKSAHLISLISIKISINIISFLVNWVIAKLCGLSQLCKASKPQGSTISDGLRGEASSSTSRATWAPQGGEDAGTTFTTGSRSHQLWIPVSVPAITSRTIPL